MLQMQSELARRGVVTDALSAECKRVNGECELLRVRSKVLQEERVELNAQLERMQQQQHIHLQERREQDVATAARHEKDLGEERMKADGAMKNCVDQLMSLQEMHLFQK